MKFPIIGPLIPGRAIFLQHQPLNVFGDDVDLEVHLRSDRSPTKGGQLPGGRDQRDLEPVARFGAQPGDRQRNPVYGDGSLLDYVAGHSGGNLDPHHLPMLGGFPGHHLAGAVHVSLDDVPAEPAVDGRGALQIDPTADLQSTQIGAVKGLGHHVGGELSVRQQVDDRQAHAVDGNRVAVSGIAGHDGAANGQPGGVGEEVPAGYLPEFLDNSGEHCTRLIRGWGAKRAPRSKGQPSAPFTMQGMQTRHRLWAVLASLSLATAVIAGCSSDPKPSGGPLPDATTLVKQSADATKNVKSGHLVLTVNGKISGMPIKVLTGDLTVSPATAAKGNATITLGGSDIQVDFAVVDGDLYATLTPNKWSDFGKASDIYDVSVILNPDTGLSNALSNFSNAKAEGRETINGQTTIKISGNVSADAVNKLVPPFNASQPVPATVWIQESGDHQLVQANLQKSSGNSVQMTFSNWGATVNVTKPPVSS